jgi:Flp pilus assembly pilin Flp
MILDGCNRIRLHRLDCAQNCMVNDSGGSAYSTQIPLEDFEMRNLLRRLWREDAGQDIAEYAVMLAVILVIVVGTIRLIGSNANNVFSSVASSISQ